MLGLKLAPQAPQVETPQNRESFMGSMLSMLCIVVRQADTPHLVQLWLDRFERFIKLLMVVSESWKSRMVSTLYSSYQRKFTEVITFGLSFLFHEIHSKNGRGSPTSTSNPSTMGTTTVSSPKD